MTDTPIDQDLTQRVQEFLEALSELSQRTGIMITGCERCGAPRLQIEHPSRERGAYIVDRIPGSGGRNALGPSAHGFACLSCEDLELALAEGLPGPAFEFRYLRWRPERSHLRGEMRPSLDGTPLVLGPSDGTVTGMVDEVESDTE